MTTEQKEQLREVLIDYLQVLTSTTGLYKSEYEKNEPRLDDDIALGIELEEEEDDTGEPDRMWGDD